MVVKVKLLLFLLLGIYQKYSHAELTSSCKVVPPGRQGRDGLPGRDGRDGPRGETGDIGPKGETGWRGDTGYKGIAGVKGDKGSSAFGRDGDLGRPGVPGRKGSQGDKGTTGIPGKKGHNGDAGEAGQPGDFANSMVNMRQLTWNQEQSQDSGKLQEFDFVKRGSSTLLRVAFSGNTRSRTRYRCNRWYFTFNGEECSNPGKIEATVYQNSNDNMLKPMYFEGLCSGISRGTVTVALYVGTCRRYSSGDAHTGFRSMSRIIVEEINAL